MCIIWLTRISFTISCAILLALCDYVGGIALLWCRIAKYIVALFGAGLVLVCVYCLLFV